MKLRPGQVRSPSSADQLHQARGSPESTSPPPCLAAAALPDRTRRAAQPGVVQTPLRPDQRAEGGGKAGARGGREASRAGSVRTRRDDAGRKARSSAALARPSATARARTRRPRPSVDTSRPGPAVIAGWARSRPSASACAASSAKDPDSSSPSSRSAGSRPTAARGEHRQRRDALAQVGARRLAGLGRLARDVEDVVGQLERDADPLAEPGDESRRSSSAAGQNRAEPRRGRDQRAGLVGQHLQVVLDRVLALGRPDRLVDLARHSRSNVLAWIRTASGRGPRRWPTPARTAGRR